MVTHFVIKFCTKHNVPVVLVVTRFVIKIGISDDPDPTVVDEIGVAGTLLDILIGISGVPWKPVSIGC